MSSDKQVGPSNIGTSLFDIFKCFQIEAAHRLPKVPYRHKCSRLQAHSYEVEIHVAGVLNPKGWVIEFADIKADFQPLYDQLDHNCLNQVEGLENPTSKRLAEWIWERLKPNLEELSHVVVREPVHRAASFAAINDRPFVVPTSGRLAPRRPPNKGTLRAASNLVNGEPKPGQTRETKWCPSTKIEIAKASHC